ncbi:TIGR02269 family lipoprotein [Archangium violaceum]|uniref:TIGR02269 family lipoprotein n=1 Tax=Archangium violaceum TaxID=83451 RepID=UPI001EF0ADF4|nr:TIGR02269 family lipoprotein [Archangium violaceum]
MLALALLSTGCASTPPPGRGTSLRYTPREAPGPASAQGPGVESPRILVSTPESETPQRLHRSRAAREEVTAAGPDSAEREARQRALAAQLAFRGVIREVSGSTRRISGELARLNAGGRGLASGNGVFLRYADYGATQLRWLEAQLAAATRLANAASEVEDPDMQLALLRVAGPRLEAAMVGSLLLAVWLDFLNLADVALEQHLYPVETLFADMWRRQEMLEPAMTALSSREHGQVEAAARGVPPLVGHLTSEFAATVERMRVAAEHLQKMLVLKDAIETVTMLSTMRFSLPLLPPSAPALVGIGLSVGSDGVMMGTRIVVSAEWVEMVRQLVRAGVLSLPVVSAAVRIQAGQVMLAQAHGELPRGVRDALGDGPEVGAMHETGKAGAGMAEPPRHHVLPKEFREWFEKRGFTGEMDIDEFCVGMERAHHEAIHGGGDWKLGRTWPGEWNQMIMEVLGRAESRAGRMLTRNEILKIVAGRMEAYYIPMSFIPWRGP